MFETHSELRRCAEWAFPGRLASAQKAWDSAEDIQAYINREWAARPGQTLPTASEIAAKEADWRAAMDKAATKREAVETLESTDAAMARVAEDMWEVIKGRLDISDADLPEEAQALLDKRRTARGQLT